MKECMLNADCLSAGEELFRIGRIAPSVEAVGQPKLEVEQTVFAADRPPLAMTFVEYRLAIAHVPSLAFANLGPIVRTVAATRRRTARAL